MTIEADASKIISMGNKIVRYAFSAAGKELLIRLGMLAKRCLNSPCLVSINITDRCNARCLTCERWKNTNNSKEISQELSVEEWKKFLLGLSKWIKPCWVVFTGGDPFVKEGFYEILRYANSLNIYTTVTTNGMICNERNCDRILDTGVDNLNFSLNSIEPELHNKYKGVEGTHEKIVTAIQYIKKKRAKVRIIVTLIVTNENYMILDDFCLWARRLGADAINFQVIRDAFGQNFKNNRTMLASSANPLWKIGNLEELDRQIDLLIARKKQGCPIVVPIKHLEEIKSYFRDPLAIPKRSYCDMPFRYAFVSPSGEIYLCYFHPGIGNIKNNGMRNIWFSRKAQSLRVKLIDCQDVCVAACLRDLDFSEKLHNFLIRANFLLFKPFRNRRV